MFLHLSVRHSVHKGGVHPLGRPTPPETATAADGTHLTGMYSCQRLITHPSSDFK